MRAAGVGRGGIGPVQATVALATEIGGEVGRVNRVVPLGIGRVLSIVGVCTCANPGP